MKLGSAALTNRCHVTHTCLADLRRRVGAAQFVALIPFNHSKENAVQQVKVFGLALVALGLFGAGAFRAADKDKEDPKYSIKQVMVQAHKKKDKNSPSLSDKVLNGNATKDEQAKLLELYTALGANKPPKGDPDTWKDRTTTITAAIKDVIDGKDGADVDLRKALNCKGCHSSHRGK
jgi:hypothetical protein